MSCRALGRHESELERVAEERARVVRSIVASADGGDGGRGGDRPGELARRRPLARAGRCRRHLRSALGDPRELELHVVRALHALVGILGQAGRARAGRAPGGASGADLRDRRAARVS